MRKFLTIAALVFAPTVAMSHDYMIADLAVKHPVAKETASSAMTGAGYLSVTNNGETPDRLIAVEAAFPRVEIHDVKVEDDVASMFQIEGAEIAPGETLTLAPGGKHIMFMGLNGDPFEVGETVDATLIFENAGRLDIVFNVETLEQIVETLGTGHAMKMGDHSSH